jgi:hypothetical protein
VTLAEFKSALPDFPILGSGDVLVRFCGYAKLFDDLEKARAARWQSCGLFCDGIDNHRGYRLTVERPVSASFRKMVAQE